MSLNTPQFQKLWRDAQEKPEWATTKFWEYFFKQNTFSGRHWSVASQQPPTYDDEDLRRVDLVVEQIYDDASSAALLFVEAKRAHVDRNEVENVEYQAFTACCANLYATRKYAVWAMTCVGTRVRLWVYKYGSDYLTPYFPLGDGLSEQSEYAEIANYGREIQGALEFIKKHPIPPESTFEKPPSPRPAHATLPSDWHDTEVAWVAGTPEPHQNIAAAGPAGMSEDPMSGSEWASQVEPQEMTMQDVPVVDTKQATELVVVKLEGNRFKCQRPDGEYIMTSQEMWFPCTLQYSGEAYEGSGYTGKSGTLYYAWALEPKGKKVRKTKR